MSNLPLALTIIFEMRLQQMRHQPSEGQVPASCSLHRLPGGQTAELSSHKPQQQACPEWAQLGLEIAGQLRALQPPAQPAASHLMAGQEVAGPQMIAEGAPEQWQRAATRHLMADPEVAAEAVHS
mmetsp:Transcript_147439/g.282612  ORF Transcript_147439/g.282612 Transcript_147439/m.282612 type:complete len:125 (-) Transcript_147439:1588-1962(-)